MRILLINPPYQSTSCRIGLGNWVPFGLLMVGGPLLEAGHEVRLLDAEAYRLSLRAILREVSGFAPDVVITGHAASTAAHPVCAKLLSAIKEACPAAVTVYGGVYPTYHATPILERVPGVDFIVRGEAERTTLELCAAIEAAGEGDEAAGGAGFEQIPGLVFRAEGQIVSTPSPEPLEDLDAYRAGWELIPDWDRYRSFGVGRTAVVQFSRGCPNGCTYCGQRLFWECWRHRDPASLADEIEWLYRNRDVRCVMLADENPTAVQEHWQAFLEVMAARQLPVHILTSMCATDVVRDAEILPLYRKAGILYGLLGIETTDAEVLMQINKRSTARNDRLACQLLKQHGIFSIMQYVVGLQDETWQTFRDALNKLIEYDGDYLNAVYVTPHSWTAFGREVQDHPVVQLDQRKWDYRHVVLAQRRLKPWQLVVAVKWLELRYHLRPRRIFGMLLRSDGFHRRQALWCLFRTGLVFVAETIEFLVLTAFARREVTVEEAEHLNYAGDTK